MSALIRGILGRSNLDASSEHHLSEAVVHALDLLAKDLHNGRRVVGYRREVSLGRGCRVDFMIGSLAVELKVGGSLADLTRQLSRYAEKDDVSGILVVTTRQAHRYLPETLNKKPIAVLCLGDQLLV